MKTLKYWMLTQSVKNHRDSLPFSQEKSFS